MNDRFALPYYVKANSLIHIVDEGALFREGLATALRLEGYEVKASAHTEHFLGLCESRAPEISIINLAMRDVAGVPLWRRVSQMSHGVPFIVLADEPNFDLAIEAMRDGAADVLLKPVSNEHLLQLVRGLLGKNIHLSNKGAGKSEVVVTGYKQLTRRERQVLELVVNGASNKSAGRDLGISARTIEVHRARIMSKFNARNTADLIRTVMLGSASVVR